MTTHIENLLEIKSNTSIGASRIFLLFGFIRGLYNLFDFNKVLPIPKTVSHCNEEKWCQKYWNTKWNCYDCSVDRINSTIRFTTIDDAPYPVIEKLTKKYPDLLFVLTSINKKSKSLNIVTYQTGVIQSFVNIRKSVNFEEYKKHKSHVFVYDQ
jgi:hypothetical protein